MSGGGTGGSITPLVAIFEEIKLQKPEAEFLWLLPKNDPLQKLVKDYSIPIKEIYAGKLRRYFSLRNFLDPILIVFGFFQSIFLIIKFKPQLIVSAGGFVSVPLVWAGWILRVPSLIHQQDVIPGLANKLMAPFAKIITVTFEKSLKSFPKNKTILTGNPFRPEILQGSKDEAYKFFKLEKNLPTVLILGGGTGSLNINNLVFKSLRNLVEFCQIIHVTGGKTDQVADHLRYHGFNFLTDQLKNAFAAADLVISRAGMATLTEIAALRKPSIIIPMFKSHQEANAIEFGRNNAAVILPEKNLSPDEFCQAIKELVFDKPALDNLSRNLSKIMAQNAGKKIAEIII